MKLDFFNNFTSKHPIVSNALMAVVALVAGCYAIFMMLDIFTRHGQEVRVPNVKYIPVEQALGKMETAGLSWEIDSIWNEDFRPGTVIEQSPQPGSMVKSSRVIYLTVNRITPPKVAIPMDLTEMPGSDGITLLKSLGFKNITTDTIPSEMRELILQVWVNGRQVALGTKVALNSKIKLSIGDGSMEVEEYDPLGMVRDSMLMEQISSGAIKLETDSLGNTHITE